MSKQDKKIDDTVSFKEGLKRVKTRQEQKIPTSLFISNGSSFDRVDT